jgi:uncharacterized protein YodC (DUF2158 family)
MWTMTISHPIPPMTTKPRTAPALATTAAVAALICVALGSAGSASAETVEVAKKCEALAAKAFPLREPGNPAAGSVNGGGSSEQSYFNRCVANGGGAPAAPVASADSVRVGELVQFPSGGPVMKVTDVQGGDVIVQWTTETGQIVSGTFPAVALVATGSSDALKDRQEDPPYVYRPCPSSVVLNGKHMCL